jgi:hypothetical protein
MVMVNTWHLHFCWMYLTHFDTNVSEDVQETLIVSHVLDEIQENPWFPFFLFAALEHVNLKSFLINYGDCYNIDSTMTGFQP